MSGRSEIFISYRRDDAGDSRGIYDRLVRKFGRQAVFMDRSDIVPGTHFPDRILGELDACKVVLVLIGNRWLTAKDDEGGRRLDDPNDWVASEVQVALEREAAARGRPGSEGGKVAPPPLHVIPVLLDGAPLPSAADLPPALEPLQAKQAIEISPQRFDYDVGRLNEAVDLHLRGGRRRPPLMKQAVLCAGAAWLILTLASVTRLPIPGHAGLRAGLDGWLDRLTDASPSDEHVALIVDTVRNEADPESLAARTRKRREHTRLVGALSEAGATVIAFDYYFEDATEAETDKALAHSLRDSQADVVLGVRTFWQREQEIDGETLPLLEPRLTDELRNESSANWGLISHGVARAGAMSMLPRVELARLRHDPEVVASDQLWPSLALEARMLYLDATAAHYDFSSGTIRLSGTDPEESIPVQYVRSKDGPPRLLFAFRQVDRATDSGAANEHRYAEILDQIENGDRQGLRMKFADRVVVVGSVAEGKETVMGDVVGHRVQTRIIASLLSRTYLRSAGLLVAGLGLLATALLGAGWRLRRRRPLALVETRSPYKHWILSGLDLGFGAFLLSLPILAIALVAFKQARYLLPVVYWLLAFAVAYLLLTLVERRKTV